MGRFTETIGMIQGRMTVRPSESHANSPVTPPSPVEKGFSTTVPIEQFLQQEPIEIPFIEVGAGCNNHAKSLPPKITERESNLILPTPISSNEQQISKSHPSKPHQSNHSISTPSIVARTENLFTDNHPKARTENLFTDNHPKARTEIPQPLGTAIRIEPSQTVLNKEIHPDFFQDYTDKFTSELSKSLNPSTTQQGNSLKRYLGVTYRPVLDGRWSQLPIAKVSNELVSYHSPEHPISEQYRSLIQEMFSGKKDSERIFLFTSSHRQSGTSTVLLNIAFTLLRQSFRHRILLIDANPEQSILSEKLGTRPSPGLHEWLHRLLPWNLAMQRTLVTGLHLLPAGNGEGNRGVMGQERIQQLTGYLRQHYDYTLIDCPIWGDDSVPIWTSYCDSAFLVIRQSNSDGFDNNQAHEGLTHDAKLKGYILTHG